MFFNKKYLTTAGKNLLDQAVAGSTIIWSTCATSSLSYVDDAAARELTDIAVYGKYTSFGEVEEVTPSNNGNLTITCRVTNNPDTISGTVSGEARAFGVWARLENSDTSTLVVVAFWDLNEGGPETVPDQSQSPFEATVDLYIKTSDTVISTIQSNPSWMTPLDTFNSFKDEVTADLNVLNTFKTTATADLTELNNFKDGVNNDLSDLNSLKGRVVTTHSANSTSTGDTQTIKGKKTFENNVDFNGYTTFYDSVELNGPVNCQAELYVVDTLTATDVELNNLRVADTVSLSKDNRDVEPQVQIMATGNNDTEFGELTINFKTNSGGDVGGSLVLSDLDSIRLTSVGDGNIYANNYSLTAYTLNADTLTCDNINNCENISGYTVTEEEDEMNAGELRINIEADSINLKSSAASIGTEYGARIHLSDSIRLSPISLDGGTYINQLKLNDDDSRAEIANSLAGDSTYNPIGCMRLIAVKTSGPSTGDPESTYISAGTLLSGYSVSKATFRGGDSSGFGIVGGTYPGTWKLLTDLTEQYGTIEVWNYALAVRVL